jgi:hypothetical protein
MLAHGSVVPAELAAAFPLTPTELGADRSTMTPKIFLEASKKFLVLSLALF